MSFEAAMELPGKRISGAESARCVRMPSNPYRFFDMDLYLPLYVYVYSRELHSLGVIEEQGAPWQVTCL